MQGLVRKHPKHNASMKGSISSLKRWAALTEGALTYYPSLNDYMSNAPGKTIRLAVCVWGGFCSPCNPVMISIILAHVSLHT